MRTWRDFGFLETLGVENVKLRRVLALVLALVLLFQFGTYLTTLPRNRLIDLYVRYIAARVLADGGDIYSPADLKEMADRDQSVRYGTAFSDNLFLSYTHPPSDSFLDLRLAIFPYVTLKPLYVILTAILYAASLVLIWLALKRASAHPLHWIFPLALFVYFGPTRVSMGLGQSDVLQFFLMTFVFYLFTEKNDLWTGIALGIAILIKTVPVLLLLYLVLKRRWRALFWTIATAAVLMGITFAIRPDLWIKWVTQIFPVLSTGTAYAENQSLVGMIDRLMLDESYWGLSPAPSLLALRLVVLGAQLALVGLVSYFSRALFSTYRSLQVALEYSTWIVAMILFSPIAWTHYFTWLLLPMTVLLAAILNSAFPLIVKLSSLAALAVAFWLVGIPTTTFSAWPIWLRSPFLFSAGILLIVLWVYLRDYKHAHTAPARPI